MNLLRRTALPALTLALWLVAAASSAFGNERIRLPELKSNEFVVIDYSSTTGGRIIGRQYFIRGGDTKVLTANRNIVEVRQGVPQVVNKFLLGDLVLSADEVVGLESLFVFYAANFEGNCETRDLIQIEYYRDGEKIGQFAFADSSCLTKTRDELSTKLKTRDRVSDVVMDAIVTFAEIDSRVKAANPQ